ncbi:ankyrin repeat-containing domain protein, partial [Podospora fimiseda]
GDIMCILDQSQIPAIVRREKDYSRVVRNAVDVRLTVPALISDREKLVSTDGFLLVWDWGTESKDCQSHQSIEYFKDITAPRSRQADLEVQLSQVLRLLHSIPIHVFAASYDGPWRRHKSYEEQVISVILEAMKIYENVLQSIQSGRVALNETGGGPGIDELPPFLFDKYGFDIASRDSKGRTIFMRAVLGKNLKLMEYIAGRPEISVPALYQDRDNKGRTPLMVAAKKGYVTVVQKLLKTDECLPNARDNYGQTAAMLAIARHDGYSQHHVVLARLLQIDSLDGELAAFDPLLLDVRDSSRRTILMIAAERGWVGVVEEILTLEAGRSLINVADEDNRTALIHALRELRYIQDKSLTSEEWMIQLNILRRLLGVDGIDVDAKDNFENSKELILWAAPKSFWDDRAKPDVSKWTRCEMDGFLQQCLDWREYKMQQILA